MRKLRADNVAQIPYISYYFFLSRCVRPFVIQLRSHIFITLKNMRRFWFAKRGLAKIYVQLTVTYLYYN
jgi:hypothetical protein